MQCRKKCRHGIGKGRGIRNERGRRLEMKGDCVSDKSWLIEISAGTGAQCYRQEARKLAKAGKAIVGLLHWWKEKGQNYTHFTHSHPHTCTQTHTGGRQRDAVFAAVRVKEIWHTGHTGPGFAWFIKHRTITGNIFSLNGNFTMRQNLIILPDEWMQAFLTSSEWVDGAFI